MIMCLIKFSKDWGVVEEVELKRVVIVLMVWLQDRLPELHMIHMNRNDWNNNNEAASSFHLARSHPKFVF